MLVLGQDERVSAWVAARCGVREASSAHASIGYERDHELIAGVAFDGATDTNVFAHIASAVKPVPLELLIATCNYAYKQLGAKRMTFMVQDDNWLCRTFIEKMGARFEASIQEGHSRGDMLLYVLWAHDDFPVRLMTHRVEGVASEETQSTEG